ncbi:unnamed protein product [Darwinula stevensoni]|uniref:DUF3456 domain-containing protein n=1 Tax=Darwinula stevensoni TaxID=69355 RepID=A0A7R8XCQ0_9CRUS|nr:unnamed protein product [Darwinula stevensoni]CAG0887812.1 unnamed protein product [Darwinula stevensoni]
MREWKFSIARFRCRQNFNILLTILISCVFFAALSTGETADDDEVAPGVKLPSTCEVCKVLTAELDERLQKTGKSHDTIDTGYGMEKKAKKKYKQSELRLIESMDRVCDEVLKYRVHKERTDSTRFAKGMSDTFKTLHGLVYGFNLLHLQLIQMVNPINERQNKGVKVDIGMPYELWDDPSAEVADMKTKCEKMIEDHEDDIEEWYYHHQDEKPLKRYLCSERVLNPGEDKCLDEVWSGKKDSGEEKQKGDKSEL